MRILINMKWLGNWKIIFRWNQSALWATSKLQLQKKKSILYFSWATQYRPHFCFKISHKKVTLRVPYLPVCLIYLYVARAFHVLSWLSDNVQFMHDQHDFSNNVGINLTDIFTILPCNTGRILWNVLKFYGKLNSIYCHLRYTWDSKKLLKLLKYFIDLAE